MNDSLPRAVAGFMVLVLCCGALIAATTTLTRERIDANRASRFAATLTELTGAAVAADLDWHDDVAHVCPGQALLRGSAAGYGGDIHWLAAARTGGAAPVLDGLRITAHQETPGIADFLERPRQGWLAGLPDRTADGLSQVDTVSGATITSRALLRSLAAALTRPALTEPACPG